jgi:hypothetical protein
MILCSYANFRFCRRRIDGKTHLIGPGEWICSLREIAGWFRKRRLCDAEAILATLAKLGFIKYKFLPGTKMVSYEILNWDKFNTVLEYECRSYKDCGFFFFPICYADILLEGNICSELDAVMDLWLNTIYMDERVKGSDLGPVVYFRNASGCPLTSCNRIAVRWGASKAKACRMIGKLEELGYISTLRFSGGQGSVIYLNSYLSTMFSITDIPVDKDEVAFTLKLRIRVEANVTENQAADTEAVVSKSEIAVSKEHLPVIMEHILQTLSQCGFHCCSCTKKHAKLYILSACDGYRLEIRCKAKKRPRSQKGVYRFSVRIQGNSG